MSNKPNLEQLLAETGGSTRARRPVIQQPAAANERPVEAATAPKGRAGTAPAAPTTGPRWCRVRDRRPVPTRPHFRLRFGCGARHRRRSVKRY